MKGPLVEAFGMGCFCSGLSKTAFQGNSFTQSILCVYFVTLFYLEKDTLPMKNSLGVKDVQRRSYENNTQ